ncbi:MAG: hypothetical protein KI793_09805 [Rivularia sp. (in: Bacteria)]|nr:hypothetical protein [Rivularia sp. MS3]
MLLILLGVSMVALPTCSILGVVCVIIGTVPSGLELELEEPQLPSKKTVNKNPS